MQPTFPSAHDAPALIPHQGRFSLLTEDGELLSLATQHVLERLHNTPACLAVHGPSLARKLGLPPTGQPSPWLDLLELFAFVYPARTAAPTPRGLALALGFESERIGQAEADLLPQLMTTLLEALQQQGRGPMAEHLAAFCLRLGQAGWAWSGTVAETLGLHDRLNERGNLPDSMLQPGDALRVWRTLPKWEETAPLPPPSSYDISPTEVRTRLAELLGPGAESRAGQADFASVATAAFVPRSVRGDPAVVLAEAGTGTGKTLGYVAPASLWAERNGGAVWISTYTRHLQRQIEQETRRLYPDATTHRQKVVLRKGRENYLCLLNMEDAVNSSASRPAGITIALVMLARWALATADGDLMGGDLPGWFGDLFGHGNLSGVADRRGECIHGACPHYQKCFVEHGIRRAKDADLVIANHALVMAQAAYEQAGMSDDATQEQPGAAPSRYVFDEGHHLADAADGAFCAELSGLETAELRRWLLGAEGRRSRARGLKRRLDDLIVGHPKLETPLDAALVAAHALPAPGWSGRLGTDEGHEHTAPLDNGPPPDETLSELFPAVADPVQPVLDNPTETFLRLLRQQVLARAQDGGKVAAHATLECDLHPLTPDLLEAGQSLSRALERLATPLRTLVQRLQDRLHAEADSLDSNTRGRIEAMTRSLRRRAVSRLEAWISMLSALEQPPEETAPTHVHFIRLERRERQRMGEIDAGLHRHWLDPTIPFAAIMAVPAQGMLITSATLRDQQGATDPDDESAEDAWQAAEARTGANHFPSPAIRASLASPFNYGQQTRTFIITDVDNSSIVDLSAAFRTLFQASGGGGLGLFTAISRLRGVYDRIAPTLEADGLPLYAQHVDAMDNNTLVDIFRTEEHACLLGTDAMRDGVDVPGNALRLVAFERVPWPRPDILHRERRIHASGGNPREFDDSIARLRLRQAFGRLIRRQTDRGIFVLLDRRTPSRLLHAFPDGCDIQRAGLAEAAREITAFLAGNNTPA